MILIANKMIWITHKMIEPLSFSWRPLDHIAVPWRKPLTFINIHWRKKRHRLYWVTTKYRCVKYGMLCNTLILIWINFMVPFFYRCWQILNVVLFHAHCLLKIYFFCETTMSWYILMCRICEPLNMDCFLFQFCVYILCMGIYYV